MGSASPVMPSGEPCWDTALATDTSTKAASQATVGAVCSALLCMESALGGIKEMSKVLNNKLPGCWDPRQEARCGHPSKPLSSAFEDCKQCSPHPPLYNPPLSLLCLLLGLTGPALLSSALLWWIWQLLPGKVIHSAHLSIHTQWSHSPRLSSQPALMLCDQKTRWRKRADSVTRPPLAFHATYAPEDGSFSPQNNWADWNTATPFVFFSFTYIRQARGK